MTCSRDKAKRYIDSCRKNFWRRVFRLEADWLAERLEGCRDILSVGCGPAIVEGELAERGFSMTGLDVSREALYAVSGVKRAPRRETEEMQGKN